MMLSLMHLHLLLQPVPFHMCLSPSNTLTGSYMYVEQRN